MSVGDDFKTTVNEFLCQYHCTPHSTTGKTPAELFLGRSLRSTLDLIHYNTIDHVERKQENMILTGPSAFRKFSIGDNIYYETRNPLTPQADNFSKGIVIDYSPPKTYKIMNLEGDEIFRHEDQIKFRHSLEIHVDDINISPTPTSQSNIDDFIHEVHPSSLIPEDPIYQTFSPTSHDDFSHQNFPSTSNQ